MLNLGLKPQALSEEDLLKKYGKSIQRAIRDEIDADVETERVIQVRETLRNWLYWEGKQYVVTKFDDFGAFSVEPLVDENGEDKFTCVYNVYLSDGLLFTGAVGSRAPNCGAYPDDEDNEQHVQLAAMADAELRDLSRAWDVDTKHSILAQNAWNAGPTFIYTPYVADAHKYGSTDEPEISIGSKVDEITGEEVEVPEVTGTKSYPNGDVECHLYDCRYVTIPFHAKTIADCWYLDLDYLEHKAVLKGLFPKQLEDEKAIAENEANAAKVAQYESQQRAYTPSGRDLERWKDSHWRFRRLWLRPSHYGLIKVDENDVPELLDAFGKPVPFVKQLEDQFPDGLKITLVNGKVVDVIHERMDDVWSVCKTGTGERILSKPWGNSTIPVQDDLNDYMNMAKENVLRHNVLVAADSKLFDFDYLRENNNRVHQIVPVNLATGQDIGKLMAAVPTATMPNDLVALMTLATQTYRRDINGATEGLAGGGVAAPTYRAEKQRRDQAMLRFAPFFSCTQRAWEAAYHNGIRQRAKYAETRVRIPGEDGAGAVDVDRAALLEGGWHIEAEEGTPMSHAEQADALRWALSAEAQPVVAENILGVFEPQTREAVLRLIGLRGVHPAIEQDQKKVATVIKKLLASPPQTDIDPMTGMQAPPKPTVEPEPFIEDHALYAQLVAAWCNSPKGVREKEQNPDGYANVVAYFDAQRQLSMQTAPPPVDENGQPMPPPEGQEGSPPEGGVPPPDAQPPQPGDTGTFNTAPPQL